MVAVDTSEDQLDKLKTKCENFGKMLEVRCEDINDTLKNKYEKYDIIVINSFLHHVPDYLVMIEEATIVINQSSQFFSFQDPSRFILLEKSP